MKTTGGPLQGDTDIQTPLTLTWGKAKIRLALGSFPVEALVFARFLKSLLVPRSWKAVERESGSWLATFLTPFHNVCASVKGLPQTKHKGCTALASKYRVFFLSFFFSLALPNVATFDSSDLLSCNEPLWEKGQMQLPLTTSLAAGRWTLLLCLGFNKCSSVYLSANVFPFHFQIGTNPVCRIRNFPSLTKVEGKEKPCKVQEEGRAKNENKTNEQEPVSAFFVGRFLQ